MERVPHPTHGVGEASLSISVLGQPLGPHVADALGNPGIILRCNAVRIKGPRSRGAIVKSDSIWVSMIAKMIGLIATLTIILALGKPD